jgi:uncharacterized membrane protein HdeD (DUF308 family)
MRTVRAPHASLPPVPGLDRFHHFRIKKALFLEKTQIIAIYLNSAKIINNYMQFPSLELSDTPVRWWQITIIGLIIFLSGVDAFFWTSMFLDLLIPLFGILAFAVGVIMIAFSLSVKRDVIYQFPIFLAGILSLLVASIAIMMPGVIGPSLIIIMAFLAIINSVLLIIVGCSLSDAWKTRIVIVLFGMLTLFLSLLMALFPELTTISLVKMWGTYAWVIGILCMVAGLSMKYVRPSPDAPPTILSLP